MMSKSKQKHPTTNAIRVLKQAGVAFEAIPYKYEERGGTRQVERAGQEDDVWAAWRDLSSVVDYGPLLEQEDFEAIAGLVKRG